MLSVPSKSPTSSTPVARVSPLTAVLLVAGMLRLAAAAPSEAHGPTLADAAERSDWNAVREGLRLGTDPNGTRADGMTALHWAVDRDETAIASALLDAGARVAVTNVFGVTPLALACRNGNAELVERLLARGADPNSSIRGGETALMTAARTGRLGPVRLLLRHGADPGAKERSGQTALMWASADGHAEVVEALVAAGADIHASLPDSGFDAFFFAVREGRTEVVRRLLKAGRDVRAVMEPRRPTSKGPARGTGALVLAIENGHFDLALELLEAGADPNDQRSGFTPLHVLTWVRKPNRGEDDGAPPPSTSGTLGSLAFARKLVEHGADLNARLTTGSGAPARFNRRGATPFLMASATADLPYMRLLVELGADPSIPNADACTPLIVACGNVVGSDAANEKAGDEAEVLAAAKWLLERGADVNAVDAHGETAMHAAAYKNLPRVIAFLDAQGARPEIWNRTNRYGWTPSKIAEGHRPGNFKPSEETLVALRRLLDSPRPPK